MLVVLSCLFPAYSIYSCRKGLVVCILNRSEQRLINIVVSLPNRDNETQERATGRLQSETYKLCDGGNFEKWIRETGFWTSNYGWRGMNPNVLYL